jgi:hypothetical protein
MMPALATFGGLLAIPIGLVHGQATGVLIAALGALAVAAGGIGLVDRIAAIFVKDQARRDRLTFHARTANISIIALFSVGFAAFGAAQFATHAGPSQSVRGLVRQERIESGSRGSRTVWLSVNDAVYKWRCKWDCSALTELGQLQGRSVALEALNDGEVLGVRSGASAIVDADSTRSGLLAFDALIGAFGAAGAGVTGWQVARRTIAAPATAQGTVS